MADEVPATAPLPCIATDQEIMKQAIEGLRSTIDEAVAAMRREPLPPNGVRGWLSEWTKPPVILASLGMIVTLGFSGLYFRDTLNRATSDNTAQDEALKKITATLDPIPRLIERLTDRMDAAENRQQEELLGWKEWRKNVDQALQASRDASIEVAQNKTRSEGLDTRISRVVDLFQQQGKDLSAKLERILIEQAEVKARLEARTRDQERPFGQDQVWPDLGTEIPFVLRAAIGCRETSPLLKVVSRRG